MASEASPESGREAAPANVCRAEFGLEKFSTGNYAFWAECPAGDAEATNKTNYIVRDEDHCLLRPFRIRLRQKKHSAKTGTVQYAIVRTMAGLRVLHALALGRRLDDGRFRSVSIFPGFQTEVVQSGKRFRLDHITVRLEENETLMVYARARRNDKGQAELDPQSSIAKLRLSAEHEVVGVASFFIQDPALLDRAGLAWRRLTQHNVNNLFGNGGRWDIKDYATVKISTDNMADRHPICGVPSAAGPGPFHLQLHYFIGRRAVEAHEIGFITTHVLPNVERLGLPSSPINPATVRVMEADVSAVFGDPKWKRLSWTMQLVPGQLHSPIMAVPAALGFPLRAAQQADVEDEEQTGDRSPNPPGILTPE